MASAAANEGGIVYVAKWERLNFLLCKAAMCSKFSCLKIICRRTLHALADKKLRVCCSGTGLLEPSCTWSYKLMCVRILSAVNMLVSTRSACLQEWRYVVVLHTYVTRPSLVSGRSRVVCQLAPWHGGRL